MQTLTASAGAGPVTALGPAGPAVNAVNGPAHGLAGPMGRLVDAHWAGSRGCPLGRLIPAPRFMGVANHHFH